MDDFGGEVVVGNYKTRIPVSGDEENKNYKSTSTTS